jgi:Transposase DDE domain
MERELWKSLYQLARRLDNSWKQGRHLRYDAAVIVAVYLWAVIHDRPTSWACDPKNWVGVTPPDPLPPQPRMSVRLRSKNVQALWEAIDREMVAACQAAVGWLMVIDSKPLPVGPYSKDRNARKGWIAKGKWARGYKLHLIWSDAAYPLAWEVTGLNESETTIAKQLIKRVHKEGYLLGDKIFDSNELYAAAGAVGLQLVSPKRRPGGYGHRRHSPYRVRAQDLLHSAFGEALYEERDQIERHLGQLTNFGGGLAPLPNWVRRPHRVRTWVHSKLLINARRTQLRQETATQAAA